MPPEAVAEMPKKADPSVEYEGTKIEKELLDMARVTFAHLKAKMARDKARNYTLAAYLSQCLRRERNLLEDYTAYIREEAKKLNIRETRH